MNRIKGKKVSEFKIYHFFSILIMTQLNFFHIYLSLSIIY